MNPDNNVGQFGKINVNDTGGDSICIAFEGYRVDSSGSGLTILNSWVFGHCVKQNQHTFESMMISQLHLKVAAQSIREEFFM